MSARLCPIGAAVTREIELLIATLGVGLGATFLMDLWAIFVNRVFAVPLPNYCFVGRWLCHMVNGVFTHPSIAAAAKRPAECLIGWAAHYTVGMLFALALVALATPRWLHAPTLAPALSVGIVTVGFPLLVMQPAFGLGLAASKAPNPLHARLRSLMYHAVFGLGLYLAALAIRPLLDLHG